LTGDADSKRWTRFFKFFQNRDNNPVEQAIIEASEEGEIEPGKGTMLLSVLRLDDLQVKDIMVTRTDMACAPADSAISQVVDIIIESGHSRIPIYSEDRDNIVGVAYAKDLLGYWHSQEADTLSVAEIIRPAYLVPETKRVKELLQDFRTGKNHLAIAIDEYGGTSGLATIGDIIEVIVGDIEDEHDSPKEEDIQILESGALLVSGRTPLGDLLPHNIELTSDEVETLGGYLCLMAGYVPAQGESFPLQDKIFEILDADAKQVRQVLIK
jgi:magnesium and cobalt transporter